MLVTTYQTNRLSFGVPLEDVFPLGEIHPALKNLLLETYRNMVKSSCSVEDALSRLQGSLHERLKLKDRLIICKKFEGLNTLPGALLWVARHFIGLLPTPLMPQYSDGKKYTWLEISKECKTSLTDYATRGRHNRKLVKKLADELMRLPSPNLLLIVTLLDFLRMLAVLPGGEPKINKSAIFALVQYFSSSVFLRPFRPGWITKKDKQYYPLLLYLILKWSEIRRICIKPADQSFVLPLEQIYSGYCEKLLSPGYPLYLSKRSRNNTTQTAAPLQKKPEEIDTLIRVVPPSYNDFSFLRDTACQTENFDDHLEKFTKEEASENDKPNEQKKQVIFIRKDCCCTYSTNYETDNEPMQNKSNKYVTETESDFGTVSSKPYGWKFNKNVNTNYSNSNRHCWKFNENLDANRSNNSVDKMSQVVSPSSEFIESAPYSDNGYSKCNLISDTKNIQESHESLKTFDTIKKEEKHSQNKTLKRNILKMGWTYTPPGKDKMAQTGNITETGLISYDTPQQDYKLIDDAHRSLNEELKEKLSKMKISEKYEKGSEINYEEEDTNLSEDLAGSSSKLHLPEEPTENKKSLMNVDKIKSKLDFSRIFNARKVKTKRSFSCEQVGSGVKYEKMGSASSLL